MIWENVSKQTTLTEDFMREHANQLDWISICLRKNLSANFMTEMISYISFGTIRLRFKTGTLSYISQETFTKLEDDYTTYWNNQIRILGGLKGIKNQKKMKVPFTLDENTFPSSRSYTKLSFVFNISEYVSQYGFTGFSHSTLDTENIPLSSLFPTEQQKEAFFYSVNHFLLQNELIEKSIPFYHN